MTKEKQLLPNTELKVGEQSLKTSKHSLKPTKDSKGHWQTPKDLRQLASQANKVATMVLNNQIDLEIARTYASVTRTIAQAKNMERSRSLMTRSELDLGLNEAEDTEES